MVPYTLIGCSIQFPHYTTTTLYADITTRRISRHIVLSTYGAICDAKRQSSPAVQRGDTTSISSKLSGGTSTVLTSLLNTKSWDRKWINLDNRLENFVVANDNDQYDNIVDFLSAVSFSVFDL